MIAGYTCLQKLKVDWSKIWDGVGAQSLTSVAEIVQDELVFLPLLSPKTTLGTT